MSSAKLIFAGNLAIARLRAEQRSRLQAECSIEVYANHSAAKFIRDHHEYYGMTKEGAEEYITTNKIK